MKRLIAALCLLVALLVSLTGCGKDAPVFHEHEHIYTATHTDGTCLTFGYTEYRCHCGDRYTVADTEYGKHSPPVYPTKNAETPDQIILKESTKYAGIEGAYCATCGAHLSFERRDKIPVQLEQN